MVFFVICLAVLCFFLFVLQRLLNPSAQSNSPAVQSTVPQHVTAKPGKDPPTFSGTEPQLFKTWSFDIQEALSQRELSPEQEVSFVASFLVSNAKIWFVSLCEEGGRPGNWLALKKELCRAFGPSHDQERVRLQLLALRQDGGDLDQHISIFSSMALMASNLDELTKASIFTRSLSAHLQKAVLIEHPKTLQDAIRAARCAQDIQKIELNVPEEGSGAAYATTHQVHPRRNIILRPLTPADRDRLFKEGRCFRCRKLGHIAKFCRGTYPNAVRQ